MFFFDAIRNYVIIFNIILLLSIVFLERRRPIYVLFWITLLIAIPFVGLFFFLFFGFSWKKIRTVNKFGYKVLLRNFISQNYFRNNPTSKYKELVQYLELASAGNLTTYEDVEILSSGSAFFSSLFEDIKKAKKTIHMEYFIFRNDDMGKYFFDLMLQKKQEGVSVKIILDGATQTSFFKMRKLKKAGIEVQLFLPSVFTFTNLINLKINYRDHRKISVIDGKVAYIGGFNIGNEYIGMGKLGFWRDTALRFEGCVVCNLEKEFADSWNFSKGSFRKKDFMPEIACKEQPLITEKDGKEKIAQIVSGGPIFEFRTIRDNLLKMILIAKRTIYIATPYFMPDETIMEAMKIAALSGVKIKVIIPDKADHLFVYWINQSFVWELIDLNIDFYRYKNGFIHSKVIIVDDDIASIGTANFDYRSFYQNFEININLYGGEGVRELRNDFIEDIKESTKISRHDYGKRNIFVKFNESVFRLFSPLL
ncbi:MAG: cardiolipin synthase [Fusobacteriaceae bacterium]